jgi:hypothetical protein
VQRQPKRESFLSPFQHPPPRSLGSVVPLDFVRDRQRPNKNSPFFFFPHSLPITFEIFPFYFVFLFLLFSFAVLGAPLL